ncbi:LysR substrate-binding domain-containing protein [Chelatococcus sp. SYSU_G07232]|uniref:LysR substrate-binding domain-containing protein n=1 Tax=Chelatococcus albus TaxID=3047466 RepID=A0ABT7AD97_9HYPH|nr:hydrogen peroxide-inducible genes activator [Chelatococcus sp. SYSU_G07232]MDJ1156982.1 LysR substrate-binding domain-containing protein [Chelatococcus sp. SYSU_G07232]
MITMRQLRYFEALSRHRHFGRAAEECAVTQPALSMQIQEFEAALGTPLVERRRGEAQITEVGQEVARRARDILAEVRDLAEYARAASGVLAGPFALGAIPSVAPYLLPTALPRIRESFPALELALRETQTATLAGELLGGRLDAILVSLPIDHPDLETMPLFEDVFLLAARADSRLARAGPVEPALLGGERLLLLEEGHCLRDQALAYCGGVSASAREQFGATSLSTVVQLVANGYGVTLVPEIAVPVEVAGDARVALARFGAPQPQRVIGLAWRKSSPRTRDFAALGEVIAAAGRAVVAEARVAQA